MKSIQWSNELSVGVDRIDAEHRELIRIANVLIKAVSLDRDIRILDNVIRKLREYTVFHFSNEEELMAEVRYPKRGEHSQEHARLKQNVKDYQRILYKNESVTPEDILEFMKNWLINHILLCDRELARFIRQEEAMASPHIATDQIDTPKSEEEKLQPTESK